MTLYPDIFNLGLSAVLIYQIISLHFEVKKHRKLAEELHELIKRYSMEGRK